MNILVTDRGRNEILDVAALAEEQTGRKVVGAVWDWTPQHSISSHFESVAGAKRSLNRGLDNPDNHFVVINDLGWVTVEVVELEAETA